MSEDPYYYPGTDVLINRKNIRDKAQLERFETGSAQLQTARAHTLKGPFDLERLKATHRLLFGRVYEWAGQLRKNTGTMSKNRPAGYTVTYGRSEYVAPQIAIVFADLKKENYLKDLAPEQFAKRLAHFYGELDSVHPFRDGNSRTLRQFTTDLAREAGHTLDWNRTLTTDADRQKLFHARDLAVLRADSSELSSVVLTCLVTREQERLATQRNQEEKMPDTDLINAPIAAPRQPVEASSAEHDPELTEFEVNEEIAEAQSVDRDELSAEDHAAAASFLDEELTPTDGLSAQAFDEAQNRASQSEAGKAREATVAGLTEHQRLADQKNEPVEDATKENDRDKGNFDSKEPIAVRLTEEQTKLLLSAEYPNNSQQQTTALYNIYSGNEPVDVMNERVALDYSEDEKSFFATLDKNEKPALDAKLTQLQAEKQRATARAEKKLEPRQKQRQRDIERD